VARVLFAWELGGDLGHARRVFGVAQGLRRLGHEAAFAFEDLAPLGALAERGEWYQAPLLLPPADPPARSPQSASEILLNRGFGDALAVAGVTRAWLGIFSLWKPDVLVADYAPGALIAARASKLRHVAIGSGFSTPPPRDPMPALRSWSAIEETQLRRADAALLEGVRGGLERAIPAAALPERASDIFRVDENLLCTWPELDPFGARPEAQYVGPQDDPSTGVQVRWQGSAHPRVFAYIKPRSARFPALLDALAKLPGESVVAAPGLTPQQAASLAMPNRQVRAEPIALAPLLPEADLCVCHAGPGTVAHALAAGVPLALLPEQFEQYLVGRAVVAAGAGVMIAPDAAVPDLGAWLAEAARNEPVRRAAATSPLLCRAPIDAAARIAAMIGA